MNRDRVDAIMRLAEEATVAMRRVATAAQRVHFALLDFVPDEERTPRSWEVEREEFMRHQGESLS